MWLTDLKNEAGYKPVARLSPAEVENVIARLGVHSVRVSQCLVEAQCRSLADGPHSAMFLYVTSGNGILSPVEGAQIDVCPHKLIILPPSGVPAQAKAADSDAHGEVEPPLQASSQRLRPAGECERVAAIYGFFHATHAQAPDLFGALPFPIAAQFSQRDGVDWPLQAALNEFHDQHLGMNTMLGALITQVLIKLFRRALNTDAFWAERALWLTDPRMTQAFAQMATFPERPHPVATLTELAGLRLHGFL